MTAMTNVAALACMPTEILALRTMVTVVTARLELVWLPLATVMALLLASTDVPGNIVIPAVSNATTKINGVACLPEATHKMDWYAAMARLVNQVHVFLKMDQHIPGTLLLGLPVLLIAGMVGKLELPSARPKMAL
jgi:hypothetical protein